MMIESPPHEVVEALAAEARSNASSMDFNSQDLENISEIQQQAYNHNHNNSLSVDSAVHEVQQHYNHVPSTSSNVSEILEKAVISPATNLPVPATALTFTRRNPPVHLEWKDINYHVNVREKIVRVHKKTILNNVSGSVGPGEILAIMGPSGCGKTTLLDILSGRIINNISGDLLVNGAHQLIGSRDYAWYRSLIGYVYQDDIQHGNLTVYEVILLQAMLRLPSSLSLHEKKARVLQVIHELGLTRCMNTKIGIPGVRKSLSGGERKRVSIAQELITDPSVIFLDEPTTGLDSKTAFNLLKLLRKIAMTGRTIILTIHQPRADIFEMFDKLLLLTRGNVAYFGKTSHALPYFKSIGYPCPAQYNPADFCIDLLVQGRHTSAGAEVEDEERINRIINHFKEKSAKEHIQLLTEPVPSNTSTVGTGQLPPPPGHHDRTSSSSTSTSEFQYAPLNTKRSQYSSNWFVQLFTVFIRSFINIMRDRTLTVAKFFQTIGMGLFVGFIFFQLGNDQTSIQSRQGVLFFVMMGGIYSALMIIPKEQEIVRRERLAKSYRVSSYFIAKNLAEVPSLVIFPTISTSLLYWIVGFNPTAERFFTFVLIVIILSFTSQAFGQFIATLIPKPTVSVTLTSTCLTVFMLLGGFYLNRNSIPDYLEWVYWLSFFHYGYEALIINEFKDQVFVCTDAELVGPRKVCPITNGNTVIDNLGMNSTMSNIWIDIALLLALAFGYLILTYLVLRFIRKPLWYRFRLPSFNRSK